MTNLHDETLQLIGQSTMTQRQIAEGAGVGLQWFLKFVQGRIASPGVDKVQAVYDYLSQTDAAA